MVKVSPATNRHNLVRQCLRLLLLLFEVRGVPIEFSCIGLLVKSCLDTKELLVHCELIPIRASRRSCAKSDVVAVGEPASARGSAILWDVVCPCLQWALPHSTVLADVSISLEGLKQEMSLIQKYNVQLTKTHNHHLVPLRLLAQNSTCQYSWPR